MHYSAKHGLAIACRLTVRPSVRDVGGSGRHTLEIFETNAGTISTTTSLFVAKTPSTYSEGNMGKF